MPPGELALLQKYMPLMIAEYERIGMATEMQRYFKGSGDMPITEANCEAALRELRAVPSGIGFDAFRARIGMNANHIRRLYLQLQSGGRPDEAL